MSYSITLTNGIKLFDLSDGVIDTTHASISLVGKNSVNFGQKQNNNLIHMLENFANGVAPSHPLIGQLWYNTANSSLSIYRNDNWDNVPVIAYSSSAPYSPMTANLWFDTTVNQLKIYNGTSFNTIGPEAVAGYATTRMASESVKDVTGGFHPVIKCTISGNIIAVLSSTDFEVSYDNSINGIPRIYSGLTMKSGYSIIGTISNSSKADLLKSSDGTSYRVASITPLGDTLVERDNSGGISANTLTASNLAGNSSLISGSWSVSGSINPQANNSIDLGSTNLRWATVYATISNAGSVATTDLNATGNSTHESLKFKTLSDSLNNKISVIDRDISLSASSDSRLPTQRAIKSYIDSAIASTLATLRTADISLQDQITNLFNVPTGTILHHAGSTAPTGYLIANGSTVSKSTYYNLWIALGGDTTPYGQTSQTFNLPDLRGEFIRGSDLGRGIDINRTIGSSQTSQNLSHSHSSAGGTNFIIYPAVSGQALQEQEQEGGPQSYSSRTPNTNVSGGTEARPRNVALLPIIKT